MIGDLTSLLGMNPDNSFQMKLRLQFVAIFELCIHPPPELSLTVMRWRPMISPITWSPGASHCNSTKEVQQEARRISFSSRSMGKPKTSAFQSQSWENIDAQQPDCRESNVLVKLSLSTGALSAVGGDGSS